MKLIRPKQLVAVLKRTDSTEFPGWRAEYFECGHSNFTTRPRPRYDVRECRQCTSTLSPTVVADCNPANERALSCEG